MVWGKKKKREGQARFSDLEVDAQTTAEHGNQNGTRAKQK
jgi:hypothetical protein